MLRWELITLHKHTGLVLAFLLVINELTHARLLTPVKMPSNHIWYKGAGIKHTIKVAHNTLLSHTPTGNSSDKN